MTPAEIDALLARVPDYRCESQREAAPELRAAAVALRAEVEALRAARDDLSHSLDNIRDAVLHERYQLEGYDIDGDVINAVLGVIDDNDPRPAMRAASGAGGAS